MEWWCISYRTNRARELNKFFLKTVRGDGVRTRYTILDNAACLREGKNVLRVLWLDLIREPRTAPTLCYLQNAFLYLSDDIHSLFIFSVPQDSRRLMTALLCCVQSTPGIADLLLNHTHWVKYVLFKVVPRLPNSIPSSSFLHDI